MGILFDLVSLPVTGPVKALTWIAGKVNEQVEKELYSADAVRGKLIELELRLDMGEITEEEYMAAEDVLLAQLRMIREREAAKAQG